MNLIGLLASFLHIVLLVVMYLVIPKLVAPEKKEVTEHWILASFSAIFLLLTIVSVKNTLSMFVVFLIGAVILSGIIWWIPTYIAEEDQDLVSHILIIVSSVAITSLSMFYSLQETEVLGLQQTGTYESLLGGRRKRR